MPGADTLVDAEKAVKEYLEKTEVNKRLTGTDDTITVVMGEFNPDSPSYCIMVQDAGGLPGDAYNHLDRPMIRVWVRAKTVEDAKKLTARVDDELHMLGPKEINDEVFCLSMLRNTRSQRLDDPDNDLPQYFLTYTMVCRRR